MWRSKTNLYGSLRNNFSTGYSTLSNSIKFHQKSLSQIKKENQLSKQNNRRYIESMYRSGNMFKYERNPSFRGTYRSHLQNLEYRVNSLVPEIDFEKNRIQIFNTQCTNLRIDLKNDYKILKREMVEEVDKLQNKLTINLNAQKIENQKLKQQIKTISNELIEPKNLIVELKKRIESLRLRIDGNKAFNEDGIPVLDTKIE